MITSHRAKRTCQNYDYFSRSCFRRHLKSAVATLVFSKLASARAELIRSAAKGGPGLPAGALLRGSVAPAPVGAGPDERVTFAVLVIEEVGVDRGVEARIVELEAEVFAALVGALGPGCADLRIMWRNT